MGVVADDENNMLAVGDTTTDDELWAVSIAAHAAATFNAVLQRLGEKGQRVKVEVVNLPQYQQVSCELDLGARETDIGFRQQ